MLVKFSVKNYKQFKDEIIFDLSAGNYEFNNECVKNGVVKTALIYGENGTGKTNFTKAITDLVSHLGISLIKNFDDVYLSADANDGLVKFDFEFLFNKDKVNYRYSKNFFQAICDETLLVNDNVIVNYSVGKPIEINGLVGTDYLLRKIPDTQDISAINYIYSNTVLSTANHLNMALIKLVEYVRSICIIDTRLLTTQHIQNNIISNGNLLKFNEFLNQNGVDCSLEHGETTSLYQEIFFKYDKCSLPFAKVASRGTIDLACFYYFWQFLENNENSLVIIDEFDASYHFKLSKNIVNKLKELPNTQVILTTHNTNLLNNDLIRPDCGFIIDGKQIKALQHCTKRELRHAHNLEKMYKAGSFNV